MGKTALAVLEEEAEWAEDRVLYSTLDHFSENMDEMPVPGMGLGLIRRSAEKRLVQQVEDELVPVIEEHMEAQFEVVEALASGRDPEDVRTEHADRLLATNPLWEALEGEDVREELLDGDMEVCQRAAVWVEEAGDEEFEDFADLAVSLGHTPAEARAEIEPLLDYLPALLEEYRNDLDLSAHSSLLESGEVREWFVDTLVEGLEQSQAAALDELEERVRERHSTG
ncbi:MAG: hypothetical protein ABEI97_02445 [Candidatus Nanohaloarchaea archaeon]